MTSRRVSDLGRTLTVKIPGNERGLVGRTCPIVACSGYFKIKSGTGLPNETRCYCPYCGNRDEQGKFTTDQQIEYARSAVKKLVVEAFRNEMEDMFRGLESTAQHSGGLMSVKLNVTSEPVRLHRYRDPNVETEVQCTNCTLVYAVFGVFGYCPDCGRHNTLDILDRSLTTLDKTLAVIATCKDADVGEQLLGNAVEDLVSVFDGFGRELVKVELARAMAGTKAPSSFQNLTGADDAMEKSFGIRLSSFLDEGEWSQLIRLFGKRHLLSHRMGVIDKKCVEVTQDADALVGRKVSLSEREVREGIDSVRRMARGLVAHFFDLRGDGADAKD